MTNITSIHSYSMAALANGKTREQPEAIRRLPVVGSMFLQLGFRSTYNMTKWETQVTYGMPKAICLKSVTHPPTHKRTRLKRRVLCRIRQASSGQISRL